MFWAMLYCLLKIALSRAHIWMCIHFFRGTLFLWVEAYIKLFFSLDICSSHFHYRIHWTYMFEWYSKKRFMYFHLEITLFSMIMFYLLPIWQRTFLFSLLMTKENYSDARHFIVFSTLLVIFLYYLGSYILQGLFVKFLFELMKSFRSFATSTFL